MSYSAVNKSYPEQDLCIGFRDARVTVWSTTPQYEQQRLDLNLDPAKDLVVLLVQHYPCIRIAVAEMLAGQNKSG